MSSVTVSPPKNFQLQSPLVRLPAEIQHIIYGLCFTANLPIADPVIGSKKQDTDSSPSINLALLQTCRRTYFEVDRRPLFAQNVFRFTTVDKARAFFHCVDAYCRSRIHDIEIDVRRFGFDNISREWLQYLSRKNGPVEKTPGSLYADAPGLDTLRLNFESWPRIPLFRSELWKVLKNLLSEARGLKRVVVIGASKGAGMAKREPWSPTHFIGADDVGTDELVPRMWSCVQGADGAKVIRWLRKNGQLQLEVVSKAHLLKNVDADWTGPSVRQSCADPWPVNGSCTLAEYQNRDTAVIDATDKDLSPNAAL